jgi:hypothetical protein
MILNLSDSRQGVNAALRRPWLDIETEGVSGLPWPVTEAPLGCRLTNGSHTLEQK